MRNKLFYSALFFATSSYFIYTNWNIFNMGLFENETRLGSRDFGVWTRKKVPYYLRSILFGFYSYYFGVVTDDMVKSFSEYETINSFFTREVKPRSINQDPGIMVSPADSKILSVDRVTKDSVLAVKGVDYSLGQFLYGQDVTLSEKDLLDMKVDPENELVSVVYYLSPGDYHRYHSHDFWSVSKVNHIPGFLDKVKDTAIHKDTYTQNERVIVFGDSPQGKFYYGIVGATNVGSMDLAFDPSLTTNIAEHDQKVRIFRAVFKTFDNLKLHYPVTKEYKVPIELKRGEEVGKFNMGSTIVLITEVPKNFKFNIRVNERTRMGDVVGQIL